MKKGLQYKSEESREREQSHWFGQPNGNPTASPSMAVNQREFYRWCECKASEEELRAYVNDTSNPMARRKFVATLVKCETVQDFFDLTNQTHGKPKEIIEIQEYPHDRIEIIDGPTE